MKKNGYKTEDLDLFDYLFTLWNKKIKITVITIISILIGVGYDSTKPNLFENSLVIKQINSSKIQKLAEVHNFIGHEFNSQIFLDGFVINLMDYQELISVLKDNKNVKEKISDLVESDQQQELYNYAKLLTTDKNGDSHSYNLNFTWHNSEEAKDIIDQTLKLALINYEKLIFDDLQNRLDLKLIEEETRNINRIYFLTDQSVIAKALNMKESQVDLFILYQTSLVTGSVSNAAYYLRGYKAIDKEISIIKKEKKYKKEFVRIARAMNLLKEIDHEWINYNILSTETKSLKNYKKTLKISILLGLFFAIFEITISYIFQSHRLAIKKN